MLVAERPEKSGLILQEGEGGVHIDKNVLTLRVVQQGKRLPKRLYSPHHWKS